MSKRDEQKKIAAHTVEALKMGFYILPNGQKVMLDHELNRLKEHTILYSPKDGEALVSELQPNPTHDTRFHVTKETTLRAAKRLTQVSDSPLLVLNFASAKNPGGGYLNGSTAQEESLARSSGLVVSLESQMAMYRHNRQQPSAMYSDYIIYSPAVPVFKDDAGNLEASPYNVSFITAPAVNKGAVLNQSKRISQADIDRTMRIRIDKILAIAALHGYERLVLGAFGCGVFRNEPNDVARYFKESLTNPRFKGRFKEVTFAILDNTPNGSVIAPFRKAF